MITNNISPLMSTSLLPLGLVVAMDVAHIRLSRHDMPVDPQARGASPNASTKLALKAGTAICDYTIAIATLLSMNMWDSNSDDDSETSSTLDPLWSACCFLFIFVVVILRDESMIKVLGNWISPQKKTPGRTSIYDAMTRIKVKIFVAAVVYGMVAFDIARFPKITGISDWLHIWAEFMAIALLKDVTGMYYLHEWMHKKAYHLHKEHHQVRTNTKLLNGFQFDCLDVAIENAFGPILLSIAYKILGFPAGNNVLGLPPVHLGAFVLSFLSDANLHSVNPYSVYFYNPVLDYLMSPNIAHQLHHCINVGYYTIIPYHQLIEGKGNDMQKYNRLCKTQFS